MGTYREQSNMFTSIASRALRTSVSRQNKLKFYGGDGQNVLAKALTLALHHNKNGNIKYRVYKTQMTGLKLDSDLWLVGCMAFGLGSFYAVGQQKTSKKIVFLNEIRTFSSIFLFAHQLSS